MGDFDGERKDLPNATAALVLGALSLVFCWCYGIIGLVLGILAVVLASAPRKAYLENPERFTGVSFKNLNAGIICGIIGICIGAIILLAVILVVVSKKLRIIGMVYQYPAPQRKDCAIF